MNSLKKLTFGIIAISISGAFFACSSDDDAPGTPDGQGRLSISAQANYTPMVNGKGMNASGIELSSFKVNFSEIEIEFDQIIDGDSIYDGDDDVELKGPFEIDLLSTNPVQLVNIQLPNGKIEEIEFEFEKSTSPQSSLYQKSMQMEGTINGNPFVFWHDFEEEIEVDFEDGTPNTIVYNDENGIVIHFDLTAVLDATPSINLANAVDGNGNGIIEIGPNDTDGNQALAHAMKQAIKSQIDLLDD